MHGFSLEAQKDRLIAYCQSQGWKDYEVYSDDGYSGTNLDRPALRRLIRHIGSGLIQSVVVYRLDRLSRRQRHVLYLLEEVFERHGVTFKSATEPFDTSTPLGKAMIGILAVFAQLERDTIIERTKEGHHKRARQGLWGGGPQPFGYRWNKEAGRLETVPSEARIVREMYRRFLQGCSLVEIADWAASQYSDRWWDHHVVKDMLQRPIYAGHVHYGTAMAKGNHEPIIDEVTFQSAQKEMKRREGRLPARGEYLLSGLLRCGECGEPMLHHLVHRNRGKPKDHHYYVCARKMKGSRYRKPVGPCPSHHIQMEWLDDQVTQLVRSIATSPEDLISQTEEPQAADEIMALEAELASVERKLRRWYDAFEEEAIDARELRRRVADLERERGRIELALDEAQERLRRPDPEPMLDAFHAIRDAWDRMELSEKKTLLRATIRQIVVYKDSSFHIEWNL